MDKERQNQASTFHSTWKHLEGLSDSQGKEVISKLSSIDPLPENCYNFTWEPSKNGMKTFERNVCNFISF